jgi:hypothetical protein
MILKLAQLGLLDERDRCFGFRDLASARQIAKLLADGVQLSEIIRGVSQIRKWLPEVGLANVRLHAGSHYRLEVEQPGGRTDKNGQSATSQKATHRAAKICPYCSTARFQRETSPAGGLASLSLGPPT